MINHWYCRRRLPCNPYRVEDLVARHDTGYRVVLLHHFVMHGCRYKPVMVAYSSRLSDDVNIHVRQPETVTNTSGHQPIGGRMVVALWLRSAFCMLTKWNQLT